MENGDIRFSTIRCSDLTDEQIEKCLQLFNNHYGTWDLSAKIRPGERIKYPRRNYALFQNNLDAYVALAQLGDEIIGQAFYLRKYFKEYGVLSWVMQLVVHSDYRRKGIAKTLLLSIWGFSSDYMWGLATSNAITIKTLEASTLRRVRPSEMKKHESSILVLKDNIPFAKDSIVTIDDKLAVIDTNYPVDFTTIQENLKKYDNDWLLGNLKIGQEWIAFTFSDQSPDFSDQDRNQDFFNNSDTIVRNAYGRMNMQNQPWTRHTDHEISVILSLVDTSRIHRIYDIGCGQGRHCFAFSKLGYNVTGFDYSSKLLESARSNIDKNDHLDFCVKDCRELGTLPEKADLITCLYDVIGTFVDSENNEKIIDGIYQNLSNEGFAVISVMNLELTQHIAKHSVEKIEQGADELFHLPATNTMQKSGNIFDPDSFLLETSTGVVYRKEQFENDGELSAEYVIRDKRYSRKEICELLEKHGFSICDVRCVQTGHWDIPLSSTDPKAKEILIVATKK